MYIITYMLFDYSKENTTNVVFFYSTLSASTGFFLDAILDGINPPRKVKNVDMIINATKCNTFTCATFASDSSYPSATMFIGKVSKNVIATPNIPANIPIIILSALNTLLISFFLPPKERMIPISFVLSRTLI